MKTICKFAADESGATAIEYAIIASIVALGIVTSLTSLKDELNVVFGNVVTLLGN